MNADLPGRIEALASRPDQLQSHDARAAFEELKAGLNDGSIRAAEKENDRWVVRRWVKHGILLGFRIGALSRALAETGFRFFDKDTFPLKDLRVESKVRVVPGGTAIRDGCYIAAGVTLMPPAYVNVGAYVGEGTMVDSHALVGSCAQVGQRVHLSAGAMLGGVLEPVGALPVIVEDEALIGGNTGVYEGVVIKAGAVLAAGTVITASTPVYDLPKQRIITPEPGQPLVIPENAVVVPGARAVTVGVGAEWHLSLATPVIVKYRDARTDTRTELEQWIR